MTKKSAAGAQSGVFVVDLTGLNLPKRALTDIEKAINATVQKQVGALDLGASGGVIFRPRPPWWGIWVIPKNNLGLKK